MAQFTFFLWEVQCIKFKQRNSNIEAIYEEMWNDYCKTYFFTFSPSELESIFGPTSVLTSNDFPLRRILIICLIEVGELGEVEYRESSADSGAELRSLLRLSFFSFLSNFSPFSFSTFSRLSTFLSTFLGDFAEGRLGEEERGEEPTERWVKYCLRTKQEKPLIGSNHSFVSFLSRKNNIILYRIVPLIVY